MERVAEITLRQSKQPIEKGLKNKIRRAMVPIAMFIACPGDDLAYLSGSAAGDSLLPAETVIAMFWVDKTTKDSEPDLLAQLQDKKRLL